MRMYKVIEIVGLDQNGYATFRNVDTSPDFYVDVNHCYSTDRSDGTTKTIKDIITEIELRYLHNPDLVEDIEYKGTSQFEEVAGGMRDVILQMEHCRIKSVYKWELYDKFKEYFDRDLKLGLRTVQSVIEEIDDIPVTAWVRGVYNDIKYCSYHVKDKLRSELYWHYQYNYK